MDTFALGIRRDQTVFCAFTDRFCQPARLKVNYAFFLKLFIYLNILIGHCDANVESELIENLNMMITFGLYKLQIHWKFLAIMCDCIFRVNYALQN